MRGQQITFLGKNNSKKQNFTLSFRLQNTYILPLVIVFIKSINTNWIF